MEELQKSLQDMSERFAQQMTAFQNQLSGATRSSPSSTEPSLSSLNAEFISFRSSVITCLENLQAQLEMLFKMQDEQEMRDRRKILLLHGYSESADLTIDSVIYKLSACLKCPELKPDSVSRCQRIGARKDAKPRPFLIKFKDIDLKHKIWAAKTNLKGSGLTLSEFLTKKRHYLFMTARKAFGMHKCWTRDGRIFAMTPSGSRRRIESMKDIETSAHTAPVEDLSLCLDPSPDFQRKEWINPRSKKLGDG
ncbi:unnamed protein product [Leptosia nina]|uniref:Uncharacterized protein n=1 Tax=Leptosia nina TaxID=320188 RepID=A0AAV1JXX8_9NEOP